MSKETIKLFETNAYLTEFEAEILSAEERDGDWFVVLDQTAFFPEEGGQTPDEGVLAGRKVKDVQISQNVITHRLGEPAEDPEKGGNSLISVDERTNGSAEGGSGLISGHCAAEAEDGSSAAESADMGVLRPGMRVTGRIDWDRRFSNMQNHTGEHILSGTIARRFGYHNVGFHLSPQIVTVDVDGPLTPEEVAGLEAAVNAVIYENVSVRAEYPAPEVLEKLDYRSKIEIDGPVRIVTVEGYDCCACCAPHVARTGEIGQLRILRAEKYKGGMRLTILCGRRAMEATRQLQTQMEAVTRLLSAKPEEAADHVQRLLDEIAELKGRLVEFQNQRIRRLAEELPADGTDILLFEEGLDPTAQRNLVNLLTERTAAMVSVFVADGAGGWRFISGSREKDAREVSTRLKEAFGARGGGKPVMVQGSIPAAAEADEEAIRAALG